MYESYLKVITRSYFHTIRNENMIPKGIIFFTQFFFSHTNHIFTQFFLGKIPKGSLGILPKMPTYM